MNWKKVKPEVRGAIASYRKGKGSVAIHDYGEVTKRYHVDYLGIQHRFDSLKDAKQYGDEFVKN